MASHRGYQAKHARLVVLIVLVCLAAGLFRRLMLFPQSPSSTRRELAQPNLNPGSPTPRLVHMHGRWKAVRASLGLPPLTHGVVFPPEPDSASSGRSDKRASRFDLGRRRREDEAARRLPQLHFAPDTRPAPPDAAAAAL